MLPCDNMPDNLRDAPDGVYGDIDAFLTCFEVPNMLNDALTTELTQRLTARNMPIEAIPKDEKNPSTEEQD